MTYEILKLNERIDIGVEAGESHFREFKSAIERNSSGTKPRNFKLICRDIGEALVAFANADGGELFIGVEDDGEITGIPHKDSDVEAMKESYISYVHNDTPLPRPVVGKTKINDKTILYFSISKSFNIVHQTSDGRCMKRCDLENCPVAAEHIQAERDEIKSREYDRAFVDGATIGDLDLDLIKEASETIVTGYSSEKMLQYLGLAEYGQSGLRIRRAALLLFAKKISNWHPRCLVRIVRINGTELGVGEHYNVIQDDPIPGAIMRLLDESWENLRPYLARTRFGSSGLFRESLIYPESACREALVNAIAHRDYSREGSPIEIFIFDDRMEFRSPGGLLASITIDKLTKLQGIHESRNVLIAKTLREIGYMREMGEGIPRIFAAMRDSELVDPQFSSDRGTFTLTLQHQSIFSRKDIEWLEGYREFDLNKNEQRVVLQGKDGHLLSTNEIIKLTGIVDTDDFRVLFESLRLKGIIYNSRPKAGGGGGRRREIGRFKLRTPKELEQYLGEILEALKTIPPLPYLDQDSIRMIRNLLSSKSPFSERPDGSLQALGFIDSQKRLLPKAYSYVPELDEPQKSKPKNVLGSIISLKPSRYGFIKDTNGGDYFFHMSNLSPEVAWESLSEGMPVSFEIKPSRSKDQKYEAINVSLA